MRRWIALSLVLSMLGIFLAGSASGETGPGWDVPLKPLPEPWNQHWAGETLSILWSIGFLSDTDVQQDPDRPLPRGHFVAWVAQAAGLPPFRPAAPSFTDVPADSPHFPWIESLVQAGAVDGYPDGTFRPGQSMVRAEMAKVMRSFSRRIPLRAERPAFTDVSGHWAEADILEIAQRGLITGYPDGSFQPNRVATFAEGATVMLRLLTGTSTPSMGVVKLMLQLQQGRNVKGLVTVGEMASVIAQNFFQAPLMTSGRAAVAFLKREGLPITQAPEAVLQVEEFTAWVQALKEKGLLEELNALDQDPSFEPSKFSVDLKLVRAALAGTIMPKTEVVQAMAGQCFEAVGIEPDPNAQIVTGIPREEAMAIHPGPGNLPPVAAFNVTSPVFVGEEVSYTDMSYDPEGGTIVRLWAGNEPVFTQPGRYTVTLVVVDAEGASAQTTREVEVVARPDRKPVAYFEAPAFLTVGDSVTYTAKGRDPDGDPIVEEKWTGKRSSFSSPGTYKVTLQVKDSRGNWSAPFSRNIVVVDRPGSTGTLSLSPNPARRGEEVVLTISCPSTAEKVWVNIPSVLESTTISFGDGSSVRVENPDGWAEGGSGSFSYTMTIPWTSDRPADGTYRVTVTAHHKRTINWSHWHDGHDNDGDGRIDEDDEDGNVCALLEPTDPEAATCEARIVTHSETERWQTTHSIDLVIRGHKQLLTPGGTD